MYLVELNEMIEGGENDIVEFKRKFSSPEKIAKEMIAFANSKGGSILFGIDDDKSMSPTTIVAFIPDFFSFSCWK